MNQTKLVAASLLTASLLGLLAVLARSGDTRDAPRPPAAERPHGIPRRVPWTTSRLTGSPEPPHPYRVERAFPKLAFKNPLHLRRVPGSDRLLVTEHSGKIFSFRNDPACATADLFLDPTKELRR